MSFHDIKQATKRKVNGLFFIKTKHARPNFNNHHYFQMKAAVITKQGKKDSFRNSEMREKSGKKNWRMFVNEPSGFGIDNTLKYLIKKASSPSSQNNSYQALNLTFTKAKQREAHHLPDDQNINNHEEEQGQAQGQEQKYEKKKQFHKTSKKHSLEKLRKMNPSFKKRDHMQTEPSQTSYFNMTESYKHRLKASLRSLIVEAEPEHKEIKTEVKVGASHIIDFIYIFGSETRSYMRNELNVRVSVDILPFVVGTFLKCKVRFMKELKQEQYNRICGWMKRVKGTEKSYFDVKDLVNLSKVHEIQSILKSYGEDTVEWEETIRHFYLSQNEQVLEHQYKKLMDSIKMMAALKSNIELGNNRICIYRVQDKLKIHDLLTLMEPGTYIFSESEMVMEIYSNIIKKNADLYSYHNRIKRWRSIAPLDESSNGGVRRTNFNATANASFKGSRVKTCEDGVNSQQLKSDRYERLYEMSKERYRKKVSKYNNGNVNNSHIHCKDRNMEYDSSCRLRSYGSRVSSIQQSFIDKDKLNRSNDIFE